MGFLFAYSMRKVRSIFQERPGVYKCFYSELLFDVSQKTQAFHRLQDDVPAEVKRRRLEECISVFRQEALRVNAALIGSSQLVLVEGVSVTKGHFVFTDYMEH